MNEDKKCNKNSPCQECQVKQKEKLAECEEWETNRKAKYKRFEFIEAEFCHNHNQESKSKPRYCETGGYNYKWDKCPSCQAVIKIIKSNDHGDQTEELKEHNHTSNCQVSNQIPSKSSHIVERERERESNYKPNYLPWILGGVGLLGLVGVVVYFLTRPGKERATGSL